MYSTFNNLEKLYEAVKEDKNRIGPSSFLADRYPIRFVLFDNFRDCYDFINVLSGYVSVIQIGKSMDPNYPDVMMTHSHLATFLKTILHELPEKDLIITPFSELARFYDNKNLFEFNTLIRTIKSIENQSKGIEAHRRVYIPIVGLLGKMWLFCNDSQFTVWHFKNDDNQIDYRLILTHGSTYGVKNLEKKFTVVPSMSKWLSLWQEQSISQTIISTSSSIYANAGNAQPDNAFTYCICRNAYEFLVRGLGLDLSFINYRKQDEQYWEKLALEVPLEDFNFEIFFNNKFEIHELADYKVFVKTWFDFKESYDRWLLANYYIHKFCNDGYICRALNECRDYGNVEFVESLALTIFDLDNSEDYLEERAVAMKAASQRGVVISKEAQDLLRHKIESIASYSISSALKFITGSTLVEKILLIEWLGSKKIQVGDIKNIYPELHSYLLPLEGLFEPEQQWAINYFDQYKKAKISNQYTEEISKLIDEINGSEVSFNSWYHDLKTTRTLLKDREDIEVFFWIDGLGADWIPFVKRLIDLRKHDNFYLNEIYLGRALLPSITSINKEDLQKLSITKIPKIGDIDEDAHQCRPYPTYLISEMAVVERAINEVLDKNPGRKIAIISDHGISYLSQLKPGLGLGGYTFDHSGRNGVKDSGKPVFDNKYKILEDGKTICALTHESLGAKIAAGSGCHGGCTPEEVIVPIFVISNQPNVKTWTAVLDEIEYYAGPRGITFVIKGLQKEDKPKLTYNGVTVALVKKSDEHYQSFNVDLKTNIEDVLLTVGINKQQFKIKVKGAAEEDDLFGF